MGGRRSPNSSRTREDMWYATAGATKDKGGLAKPDGLATGRSTWLAGCDDASAVHVPLEELTVRTQVGEHWLITASSWFGTMTSSRLVRGEVLQTSTASIVFCFLVCKNE